MENKIKPNISLVIKLENNIEDIEKLIKSINEQTIRNIQLMIICNKELQHTYNNAILYHIKRDDINIKYIDIVDNLSIKDFISQIASEFIVFIDKPISYNNYYFHNCRSKLIEENHDIICSIIVGYFSDNKNHYIEYNSRKNLFIKKEVFFEISGIIIKKDIIEELYKDKNLLLEEVSSAVVEKLDEFITFFNDEIVGYSNKKIDSYSIYGNMISNIENKMMINQIKKILYITDLVNEDIFYLYLYRLNSKDISIKMIDKNFYDFYKLSGIDLVILDDIHDSGFQWLKVIKKLKIPYILFTHYRNWRNLKNISKNSEYILVPYEISNQFQDKNIYTIRPILKEINLNNKIYTNIINILIPMKNLNSRDYKRITYILDDISKKYNIRVYSYIYIYSEQDNVNKEYFQLNKYNNIINERAHLEELEIDVVMHIGKNHNFEYYKSRFLAKEINRCFVDIDAYDNIELVYQIIENSSKYKNNILDTRKDLEYNYTVIKNILENRQYYQEIQEIENKLQSLFNNNIHNNNIKYITKVINNKTVKYTKKINKIEFKYMVSNPIDHIEIKIMVDEIENDIVARLVIQREGYIIRDIVTNIKFADDKILFNFKKLNIMTTTELKCKVEFYVIPPCVKILKNSDGSYVVNSGLYY